ncbi:hypothetical protein SD77_3851 [Bacillus badius]|uniref:Mobile element protein n=1 Tax=Bacillus badius TaxID=1455 RepID=A0ABR5AWS0_BACBA|nr:hypothetical protein SD78_1654 [Bacillus badius]KIL79050.1 hypothetical protein SD77_3851 [Bacillus badius]
MEWMYVTIKDIKGIYALKSSRPARLQDSIRKLCSLMQREA